MSERIMTDEQLMGLHDDIRDGISMIVRCDHYQSLTAERDKWRHIINVACCGSREALIKFLIELKAAPDQPFEKEKTITLRMFVVSQALKEQK